MSHSQSQEWFAAEASQALLPVPDQIISVFQRFRMEPTAVDQFDASGRARMSEKISAFVARNEPIRFSMLGYPFKSGNTRDKVLTEKPDLGEELSLQNFAEFSRQIESVYAPGAEVALVSDGFAFNELMKVSDATVEQYGEIVRDMSRSFPVKWFSLKDFYNTSLVEAREKLLAQWAPTPEEMQEKILNDVNVNFLYRGILIFMEAETAIWPFDSKSKRVRETKVLVRKMMIMNEAYSKMIASEFSSHIRLSMHKSNNDGTKYSFQLIPGEPKKIWTSPWHGAVLESNGHEMIHVKDAREAGCEVVLKDGQPWFFIPPKAGVLHA
jgi:pyoverdine/dityrosine biosynthesis protein Dit1